LIPQNTRTLLSEDVIQSRISQIADEINKDYADKDLVVIGVLNGACLFTADLVKKLKIPVEIGFMQVSSYGHSKTSSGAVQLRMPPNIDISGKHVLIVEDVLDSGHTIDKLRRVIEGFLPSSLRFCVFADKKLSQVRVEYTAFEVPNLFLIGYGMDSSGHLRNLTEVLVVD
jgi:hypoxanthine phosphoribosyltransferase